MCIRDRIYEVPLLPYMDRPADTRAGCKQRCTNAAMEYFKSEVMEMCHREGLYPVSYTHLDVYKRQCSLIPTPPDDEQSPGIFHLQEDFE